MLANTKWDGSSAATSFGINLHLSLQCLRNSDDPEKNGERTQDFIMIRIVCQTHVLCIKRWDGLEYTIF